MKQAISDFIEVTKVSANNRERKNIIDAARLTLGYVYFELSGFTNSVKYLQKITKGFYDRPDALLALAWSSIKLRDYEAALVALDNLLANYSDFYNVEEVYFLLGQCYLKLGYYDFAIDEYSKVIEGFSQYANFDSTADDPELGLSVQEARLLEMEIDLLELEIKLINSIPLEKTNGVESTGDESAVQAAREDLIKTILNEREEYDWVKRRVETLRKRLETRELRKKWVSYAEYGKVRAQYLKGATPE